MTATATTDLRSEHVGVGRMLGILDAMARRTREGAAPDPQDLAQAIEFLRVFVDRCHHGKEEGLLFPAMQSAGMTSAEPTIATLLAQHVQGRAAVSRIDEAAQRFGAADPAAGQMLAEAIGSYTKLLHAHIRLEENDCFAPADHELPASVQDDLAEGYERIEREVIGEGVHEAFHALLDRLEDTYRD